jgi:hypothetical protein
MITFIAMLILFVVLTIVYRGEIRRAYEDGKEEGKRLGVIEGRNAERKVVHFPIEITHRLRPRR